MQVKEILIPYKKIEGKLRYYDLSDFHTATKHCAESSIIRIVKTIKDDPFARWTLGGDAGEFIAPNDPRWDAGVIEDWLHQDNIAEDEEDHICELVSPIIDKCWGKLEGNHENEIRKHLHVDVQKNICKKLNIDNLGYSCFLRIKFHRRNSTEGHEIVGFGTHGNGCAITKGAKVNRLERMMDAFNADFYWHEHVHDIITNVKPYLTLDASNRIKQKQKVGAMTGCWFRTYSQDIRASYGEIKNYPPTQLGCPVFEIDPNTGTVEVKG